MSGPDMIACVPHTNSVLVDVEPAATMVGHVEDVQAPLRSHDILLHCSTVPDPFGQVIIQRLAAGMPVVATGAGAPNEILQGAPIHLLCDATSASHLTSVLVPPTWADYELAARSAVRAVAYSDHVPMARTNDTLRRCAQSSGMEAS